VKRTRDHPRRRRTRAKISSAGISFASPRST
jgi:hypothetical protein